MFSKNGVLGSAAIYLTANVFNAGIPFLLLPILTRVLSPSDYGLVSMFLVMLSIFGALVGLSAHGAIGIRYFKLNKSQLSEYVSTVVFILASTTAAGLIIVVIIGDWLVSITGVPISWLFSAVIIAGAQFLINIKLTLLQVTNQAKKYGLLQVSQSLFNALASLWLVLIAGLAWEGRVLGHAMSVGLLSVVAVTWMYRDKLFVIPLYWKAHGKSAIRFGLPLIPHAIGGWMMVAGDRFIIKSELGLADIGVYMVGMQVGIGLHMIYEAFFKSWHPAITRVVSEGDIKDRRPLVLSSYKVMGGSLLTLIVYSLFVWFTFPYLVGERFSEGLWVALFFAIGAFFSACYYATAIFMHIQNRNELLAINTLLTGSLGLFFSFFLCQYFGLEGVAAGMLIGKIFSFLFCWASANHVYPMPWLRPFP